MKPERIGSIRLTRETMTSGTLSAGNLNQGLKLYREINVMRLLYGGVPVFMAALLPCITGGQAGVVVPNFDE